MRIGLNILEMLFNMFNNKLKKEIIYLKSQNQALIEQIKNLTESAKNPKNVIENILNREIKWIDWEIMSKQDKLAWYQNANILIKNPVFKHIFGSQDNNEWTNGMLVKKLLEVGMIEANKDTIRDIQMTVNGIELCRQELDEIVDPKFYKE